MFFLEFELIDYVGTRSNGSGILPTVLRRRKRRSKKQGFPFSGSCFVECLETIVIKVKTVVQINRLG